MTATYLTREGDTVDAVAWRHYGTNDGRVVEAVLAENPGLAALGALLPAGTEIRMPDIEPATDAQGLRLWD